MSEYEWEPDRWFEADTEARWERQDDRERAGEQRQDALTRDSGETVRAPKPRPQRRAA